APDHVQSPGLVEPADVTGCHEAVVKILAPAGGVTVEPVGVADEDLADLSGGHRAMVAVENANLGAYSGFSRSVGRGAQIRRCRGGDHAGFGGVVVVVEDVPELVHEFG